MIPCSMRRVNCRKSISATAGRIGHVSNRSCRTSRGSFALMARNRSPSIDGRRRTIESQLPAIRCNNQPEFLMIYDFTVLGLRPNTLGAVMPKLADAIAANSKRGKLVGCFTCDFGVLNRIAVLTEYPDVGVLAEDRAATMANGERFGFAPQLASFERTAYAPL